jgi:hypothetical protein
VPRAGYFGACFAFPVAAQPLVGEDDRSGAAPASWFDRQPPTGEELLVFEPFTGECEIGGLGGEGDRRPFFYFRFALFGS